MYPWQAAAIECGADFNNLVYCAPTSGGKSLVAEVLMVRRLLRSLDDIPQPSRKPVRSAAVAAGGALGGRQRGPGGGGHEGRWLAAHAAFDMPTLKLKTPASTCNPLHQAQKYGRALVVLPYVSIVNEKSEHLSAVLAPMHASVRGFSSTGEEGGAVQPLAPRCVGWRQNQQATRWGGRTMQPADLLTCCAHRVCLLCSRHASLPAPPHGCRGETVAICTIEKANVAINRLLQEGRLGELCCVVVGAPAAAAAGALASLLWHWLPWRSPVKPHPSVCG